MKIILAFYMVLFLCPLSYGQDKPVEEKSDEEIRKILDDSQSQVGILREQKDIDLVKFIESDKDLKTLKETCMKEISAGDIDKDIGTCIWNKTSPTKQQEIIKKLSSKGGNNEADRAQYDSLDINNFKNGSSKEEMSAYKTLENYFAKKLSEGILFSRDANGERLYNMRHEMFYDIYKSQLGKNILTSISNYCIDSDPTNGYLIDEEVRSANIKLLSKFKGEQNSAMSSWTTCLLNIPKICWIKKETSNKKINTIATTDEGTIETLMSLEELKKAYRKRNKACDEIKDEKEKEECEKKGDEVWEKKWKKSRKMACAVNSYIRTAKQAIIKVGSIQKKIAEKSKKKKGVRGSEFFGGDNIKFDIEDAINVTSRQFAEESGFRKSNQNVQKLLRECQKSDSDECRKFIDRNPKKTEEGLAEYSLRSRVMEGKLERDLGKTGEKVNKEKLKKYLEEEGYTKEEVSRKLAYNDKDLESLREEIKNRYNSEREELIKRLRERISRRVVKTGKGDQKTNMSTLDGKKNNQEVYKEIEDELKNETNRMAQLIHFNNVVSGFLSTGGTGEKAKKNTRALMAELEGSLYDETQKSNTRNVASGNLPKEKGPSQEDYADFKELKSAIKQKGIRTTQQDKKEGSNVLSLTVDVINNQILEYDVDREKRNLNKQKGQGQGQRQNQKLSNPPANP